MYIYNMYINPNQLYIAMMLGFPLVGMPQKGHKMVTVAFRVPWTVQGPLDRCSWDRSFCPIDIEITKTTSGTTIIVPKVYVQLSHYYKNNQK